jgi:hypothetical protein
MAHQDERLHDIDDRLGSEGRASADAMPRVSSRTPRGPRYAAWLWLIVGLTALGFGIALGHGLLIAAGLVVAGAAGQLFDPAGGARRGHRFPRRP